MTTRRIATGVLVAMMAAAGHVGLAADEPSAAAIEDVGLAFEPKDYPTTGGSTSAHPLGVTVACRLTGTACQWCDASSRFGRQPLQARLVPVVRTTPSPQVGGATLLPGLHDLLIHAALKGKTWHQGTHTGYTRLIAGECDLIYECRPPSADERKLMADKGVELELTPIALDAFVFLRHAENPVKGLTAEQIKGIYAGKITSWQAAGGKGEVHAYVRNPNSGSQETMQSVVMGELTITAGRSAVALTMMGPYEQLPGDPQGIGFTFYYYNERMSPNPRVDILAVDDVMPSRETIASGAYRWVTPVFAVTRKDLGDEAAAATLRDWLTTPAGQSVVAESGYVPVHPVPRQVTAGELTVTVTGGGTIVAGDAELTPEALQRWLKAVPPGEDCRATLAADKTTRWAHVVDAFNALRMAGFEKIGIQTTGPGETGD